MHVFNPNLLITTAQYGRNSCFKFEFPAQDKLQMFSALNSKRVQIKLGVK